VEGCAAGVPRGGGTQHPEHSAHGRHNIRNIQNINQHLQVGLNMPNEPKVLGRKERAVKELKPAGYHPEYK
jgi:hypothetical protein